MPFILAAVVIGALIIWRLWARDRVQGEIGRKLDPLAMRLFRRRKCRWVQQGIARGALTEFHCTACGVTAYSQSSGGPRECKRGLGGGRL